MDDLSGLDWTNSTKSTPNPQSAFQVPLRQSPALSLSGRSTPLSAQQSGTIQNNNRSFKPPSKPATPANDSFASLLGGQSRTKAPNSISLQERQKQLQEERARKEAEQRKQYDAQFGAQDAQYWNALGNGKATPEPRLSTPQNPFGGNNLSKTINKPFAGLDTASKRPVQSPLPEDDILAAFNSAAPVDASSHFPPPSTKDSGRSTPAFVGSKIGSSVPLSGSSAANTFGDDDDDPFGLNQLAQKPASTKPQESLPTNDDDDILGMLGKPVSDIRPTRPVEPSPIADESSSDDERPASPNVLNPNDKAVADMVDMGFSADKAAIALAQTNSGRDVQAAVSLLLNQAHAEAKQKAQGNRGDRGRESPVGSNETRRRNDSRPTPSGRETSAGGSVPAWMRDNEERNRSAQRRKDNSSPAGDKDVSQYASEIGSSLFKQANSLWKTSQKKVQKAVADFQQDADPSMPKWMRDAQANQDISDANASRSRKAATQQDASVTDEAMMLESGNSRPAKPQRQPNSRHDSADHFPRQKHEPTLPDRTTSKSPAVQQQLRPENKPTAKLTRQVVEDQSAQAYVSPARRKKTPAQSDSLPLERPTPSPNTSRQATLAQSNNPFTQKAPTPVARTPAGSTPTPSKPKPPPRQIPPVSSSALTSSATNRQKGSDAFKRGDYAAAHSAYCAALTPLPDTHPIAIIVLCNRALTNIKVGEPKAAIADANAAIAIIGTSKGEGEKVSLGGIEGEKDMKEFFGKALMRKAEAFEHMEKWSDAGKVWREAVEAGVGGSISIQGRNRCEKAAGGGSSQSAAAKRPPRRPTPAKPSALSDLGGGPNVDSEAVKKLKAANAAADKADDEKFALTDQVDAKLIAWKGTKSDNLRALLGSLDKVLWPEAGWNKVGMSDLVMPNRVKIVYMKAIAKVHPDKVSQTATTEQKMLSAAIFSTLNEAWDKFKTENGL